jgi:serine/threonine protein kinase
MCDAIDRLQKECGVVHRDIKLWNMCLTDDLTNVKVIDFGLATPLKREEFAKAPVFFQGVISGTKKYLAPELTTAEGVLGDLSKVDTFALGVTLINLLTGQYMFENHHDPAYAAFLADPISAMQLSCEDSEELADLLRKMLTSDIESRMDLDSVKKHAWVTKHDLLGEDEVR